MSASKIPARAKSAKGHRDWPVIQQANLVPIFRNHRETGLLAANRATLMSAQALHVGFLTETADIVTPLCKTAIGMALAQKFDTISVGE
jgi:hypothetical protein